MIAVFGLGFTGLTTSLYFSEKKRIKVYGIDIDKERITKINNYELPFYEPKLENILKKQLNNNFYISDNVGDSINKSEYIFICVDTSMNIDGSADLSSVMNVLDTIIEKIDISRYRTIIVKSSIPPTTTEKIIVPYIQEKGLVIGKDIGLCVNPEFLREGHCYDELENPNRIIVGCNDINTRTMMNKLYQEEKEKIYNVNYNTAEFSKYLSNSFLANLISFSNEMSIVADCLGNIEIKEAFDILKSDNRWDDCEMRNYVHPIGKFGGYCLPKDTNALYFLSKQNGYNSRMLNDIIVINEQLEGYFVNKIMKMVDKNKKIGILGLSFKPGSDDVRNTSSYYVIKKLCDNNYNHIFAYDPVSIDNFQKTYSDLDIEYIDNYNEILDKADILIILTIWDEFKNIKKICSKMIIDFTHKI